MNKEIKIDPYGFREYDARWIYEKDIDLAGIEILGKGLGTQIIKHTKKNNPRIIVGHDYRSYSEEIKVALKKGLFSTGCNIEDSFATRFSGNFKLLKSNPVSSRKPTNTIR